MFPIFAQSMVISAHVPSTLSSLVKLSLFIVNVAVVSLLLLLLLLLLLFFRRHDHTLREGLIFGTSLSLRWDVIVPLKSQREKRKVIH